MFQVCNRPFVIQPPAELPQQSPHIKREAHALALSFAHQELVTDERLQQIGVSLWRVLGEGIHVAFAQACQYAGNKVLPIIIESAAAAIQNLPWELLHHPEHGFLGREPRFSLSRRIPSGDIEPEPLQRGPLRVLLFTSLPEDQDAERSRLAVEEEQENVLEALLQGVLQGTVQLQVPDDGRFTTLKSQLCDFRPHLVFLSGHGKYHQPLDGEDYGSFLFEDERGFSDPVTDTTLAAAFLGSSVQCVVLSACESGKVASDALNNGLAVQLTRHHLCHVVGMRESVLDRAGILFAQHFCEAIGRRARVDVALQQARHAITAPLQDTLWLSSEKNGLAELSLGQWSLPTLFSRDVAAPLIDWEFPVQPPVSQLNKTTLEGITLPAKFRGRRKELRQLDARLVKGELKQLLITGPGGQGKTALAGKLALSLQKQGWDVVAWCAKEGKSWDGFVLDLQLKLHEDHAKRYDRVLEKIQDPTERAGYLLQMLVTQCRGRLLVLLDNLETLQDSQNRSLTDPAVQSFITAAQGLAAEGLLLLGTSRWLLPGWPTQNHWSLEHLSYGDFLQLCLLQSQLLAPLTERRQRLRRVYKVLNGNGRGLTFFAAAVQGMALAEEERFLEALSQAEEKVQIDMALNKLLDLRTGAQLSLLQRMQWFEGPIPVEGVVKIAAGLAESNLLLSELVAFSLVEKSHHPDWLADEYHTPTLVSRAVNQKLQSEPESNYATIAANYQAYLFRNERHTQTQAQVVYRAFIKAELIHQAHRLALNVIVNALSRAGLYRTLLEEWLPEICLSDDDSNRADALDQTGRQHLHLGNYDSALTYLQQSLAIRLEIGDRAGEGATLNNLSQIYDARGDYDSALTYLQQSLAIRLEIGDISGRCITLFNIGHIHAQKEEWDNAMSVWVEVAHGTGGCPRCAEGPSRAARTGRWAGRLGSLSAKNEKRN